MKNTIVVAAVLGALAVAIGAFGAHALKNIVIAERLPIFETGVRYQFYHVFALLGVGLLANQQAENTDLGLLRWTARLFIAGIICFSGSLYLLACRDVLPFSVALAGPITPFGGVLFIGGWLCLAMFLIRK